MCGRELRNNYLLESALIIYMIFVSVICPIAKRHNTEMEAMSLEIIHLAALSPPPHISYCIERGTKALGISIPPLATTKAHFVCVSGGI